MAEGMKLMDAAQTAPADKLVKTIHVYVCPTPGCPDYYADGLHAKTPLDQRLTGSKIENKHAEPIHQGPDGQDLPRGMKHTRAQCPTCRTQGRQVERVLCTTTVLVPRL